MADQEDAFITHLMNATDQGECWNLVLQHKALKQFVNNAKAAVIVGQQANQNLK